MEAEWERLRIHRARAAAAGAVKKRGGCPPATGFEVSPHVPSGDREANGLMRCRETLEGVVRYELSGL